MLEKLKTVLAVMGAISLGGMVLSAIVLWLMVRSDRGGHDGGGSPCDQGRKL